MTGVAIGQAALIFAAGMLFCQAAHWFRRQRKFAEVRAKFLKAKADGKVRGLHLEREDLRRKIQTAEHTCSFGDRCARKAYEAERAATEARVKNGGNVA